MDPVEKLVPGGLGRETVRSNAYLLIGEREAT